MSTATGDGIPWDAMGRADFDRRKLAPGYKPPPADQWTLFYLAAPERDAKPAQSGAQLDGQEGLFGTDSEAPATCELPGGCPDPAEVMLTAMCVHEHISRLRLCVTCCCELQRADDPCVACEDGREPHTCPVAFTVTMLDGRS
jgi:hypothetical protein